MSLRRYGWAVTAWVTAGCVGPGAIQSSADEAATETSLSSEDESESESETETLDTEDDDGGFGHPQICDFGTHEEWPPPLHRGIDLLVVIDNSSTMADEQAKLVASLELLVERLGQLHDSEGLPFEPDVNIMVTTSDMGHPLCAPAPGYQPKQGAPQDLPCIERLGDFADPSLCTQACPVSWAPADPFVHFHGNATNVPGNEVVAALRCLVPQGSNGCEYGAPLEAMVRALDPTATWNQADRPFLREDAMLAIAIVSDSYDCSVQPEGYAYFSDPALDQYWELDPQSGSKAPSLAICWNAGVECGEPDSEGVYADCSASDKGVLHPLERYVDFLAATGKPILMLDLLGVPPVTAHAQVLPFQPIAGGFAELIHRDWREGNYPIGDLLPGDQGNAASKQFEFGIGPGCFGESELGEFTGQALPPVRSTQLCQQLEADGDPRCCIESSCDSDYSAAVGCLAGVIQTVAEEF